jgi:NAD(P) transhydrogenase subunit alpha
MRKRSLILFVLLLVFWLVISAEMDLQHILVGMFLALITVWFWQDLGPRLPSMPSAEELLRLGHCLVLLVGYIIQSNITVAKTLLFSGKPVSPVFVEMETPIRSNRGRVLLATCITITPGTVTIDVDPETGRFIVHALTSMSTVAGYKSVLIAANRLAKFMPMMGTAIGMIQPSNVLVIGTGVAGLQAIATAKRLGAVVYAADIRPDACEQAKSVGAKVIDIGIPPQAAIGEGGYAKHLTGDWLKKEKDALKDIVSKVDIIILSALVPGKVAPVLITEEMVKAMKKGSIIMDVAIDQGGNCEITESGYVTEKYGITIDGTKNIPGMLPASSTWMFANNIFNFLCNLVQNGEIVINQKDEIISSSLVTYKGNIVHSGAREAMKL